MNDSTRVFCACARALIDSMGNEIVLATFFFFVNCCVKVKKVENCKCWILEIDFLAPEKEVCLAVLIATTAWQLLEF